MFFFITFYINVTLMLTYYVTISLMSNETSADEYILWIMWYRYHVECKSVCLLFNSNKYTKPCGFITDEASGKH